MYAEKVSAFRTLTFRRNFEGTFWKSFIWPKGQNEDLAKLIEYRLNVEIDQSNLYTSSIGHFSTHICLLTMLFVVLIVETSQFQGDEKEWTLANECLRSSIKRELLG